MEFAMNQNLFHGFAIAGNLEKRHSISERYHLYFLLPGMNFLLFPHWMSTPGFKAYLTILIPLADVPLLFTTCLTPPYSPSIPVFT